MAKAAIKKISTRKVATKKRTATAKPTVKKSVDSNVVKPFVFRTAEHKHLGDEPAWEKQPRDGVRVSTLAHAFTWYRYYFTNKEAKEMLLQWLQFNARDKDAKAIRPVSDEFYPLTHCWLARMNLMGLLLKESESKALEAAIEALKSLNPATQVAESEEKRVTIQDRLFEKAKDALNGIDSLYDQMLSNGVKLTADIKPIDVLRSINVAPQFISTIADEWSLQLAEFKVAYAGEDEYVAESYSAYSKIQLRTLIKFAELVIADCHSYGQVKKTERKPRAKKAASPEKIALKFKFQKEIPELKIKSEPASKMVAAQEAWLYDVSKRKIIHVVADANAGSLTIKGASVVGFDATQTVQKTIRKPEEMLAKFSKEGKPALRKVFKEIKTTETKWTGRSNENLVILRVW